MSTPYKKEYDKEFIQRKRFINKDYLQRKQSAKSTKIPKSPQERQVQRNQNREKRRKEGKAEKSQKLKQIKPKRVGKSLYCQLPKIPEEIKVSNKINDLCFV